MKIAIVSQPFDLVSPKPENSLAIWSYEVACRLSKLSEVIIYAKGKLKAYTEKNQDIKYKYIPIAVDKFFLNPLAKKICRKVDKPYFFSQIYYYFYALQIALDLKINSVDIVHILNFSQFIPIFRAINPNIKIVLNMRCDWLAQGPPNILRKRLNKADLIIGCSQFITDRIATAFPEYKEKCKTIYNGVDVNIFQIKQNNPKENSNACEILYVGRVSPEKGVHVLLEAFERVSQIFPDAKLRIIGSKKEAPYEFIVGLDKNGELDSLKSFYPNKWSKYLSKWTKSSAASSSVIFSGHMKHSQIVNHYNNADIFVFPSVWDEPFGVPIIEAMATQLPVVATQVGAFPEILSNGEIGFLVKPNDAEALAQALLKLLEDKNLRVQMGQAGRKKAINMFTWEILVKNLFNEYCRLLNIENSKQHYF